MRAKWLFCFDPKRTLFFSLHWITVFHSSASSNIVPICIVANYIISFSHITISISVIIICITDACGNTIFILLFIVS